MTLICCSVSAWLLWLLLVLGWWVSAPRSCRLVPGKCTIKRQLCRDVLSRQGGRRATRTLPVDSRYKRATKLSPPNFRSRSSPGFSMCLHTRGPTAAPCLHLALLSSSWLATFRSRMGSRSLAGFHRGPFCLVWQGFLGWVLISNNNISDVWNELKIDPFTLVLPGIRAFLALTIRQRPTFSLLKMNTLVKLPFSPWDSHLYQQFSSAYGCNPIWKAQTHPVTMERCPAPRWAHKHN